MKKVRYSWILPIKNEALSLPYLVKEIKMAMFGKSYEIIAINDTSSDKTLPVLRKISKNTPQLKIINFSSHKGKWMALNSGFEKAKGSIIITSDSDLQDNPKEVDKLLKKIDQGYDLVSGLRKKRLDPWYKIIISKFGNLIVSQAFKEHFSDINSSFKVYKRHVIHFLPFHGNLLRFSMIFSSKQGFRVAEIPVVHRARLYGRSKFGIVKYLRIIYDLVLIFLLFSGSGRIIRFRNKENFK